MSALARNNVRVLGRPDGRPMVLAHGFGCDQHMWRDVWPAFEADHRIVLFDYVGNGASDVDAYDAERYSDLGGYALDVVEICEELDLEDVVFVGHSVSAMVGVLAAARAPHRFGALVLVAPSARYINDAASGYVGGFEEADVEELLTSLESNYLGWSASMAPVIMGNAERPSLGAELTASFCKSDPAIARRFARVTFMSDNRGDLSTVRLPTLVLQCADDVIAPESVGRYVHDQIPDSRLVLMKATGHCPNLSAPTETVSAIASFLRGRTGGDE